MHAIDDAVSRYCAASERADVEAMLDTLAPDPELVSPVSGRMVFHGTDDLRVLLGAVYGSFSSLRWQTAMRDGDTCVVLGRAKLGPITIDDAMVFELAPDGRIARIRPHLRPWFGLTAFALTLVPKLIGHPRVLLHALRHA
jgi:SnoaL-like domain